MTSIRLLAMWLAMAVLVGCSSSPPPKLTVGMKLPAARKSIADSGGRTTAMGMTTSDVYELPDGRVIVLSGSKTLDSITVIDNPDQPKSKRKHRDVNELTL